MDPENKRVRPRPRKRGWLPALALMASGAASAILGAAGQDILEDGYPSKAPVVVQLPDGQIIIATPAAQAGTVSVSGTKQQSAVEADCDPVTRQHLNRIKFWGEMQDAHQELQQAGSLLSKNEEVEQKIDRARERIRQVMAWLAKCREDA